MRGDWRSRRISELRSFSFFHTAYGTPPGPGANDREDLDSPYGIPPYVLGSAEGWCEGCSLRGR